MKKSILSAALIFIFANSNAGIYIEDYRDYVDQFEKPDSLVFGNILLQTDWLRKHRFFGPINDGHKADGRIDGKARSYKDTSTDPMTTLVIKLFPSAGLDFSTEGTGTLRFLDEDELISFIANMFSLADDVRNRKADYRSKRIKPDGIFFGVVPDKKRDYRLRTKNIQETIINAVLSEDNDYPYNYTNYVISAFAWEKLSTREHIERLAKRIKSVKFMFILKQHPNYLKEINEALEKDIDHIKSKRPLSPEECREIREHFKFDFESLGYDLLEDSAKQYEEDLIPLKWSWDKNLLNKELANCNFEFFETLLNDIGNSYKTGLVITYTLAMMHDWPYDTFEPDDITAPLGEKPKAILASSIIPFSPFMNISSGERVNFKNQKFTNCAETMLKFLVVTFLFQKNPNEKVWNKAFEIDLKGFDGTPIFDFFQKYKTLNAVAFINDKRTETWLLWNELVEAVPGIRYCNRIEKTGKVIKKDVKEQPADGSSEGFEMKAEWINILTAFCKILLNTNAESTASVKDGSEKALTVNIQKIVQEASDLLKTATEDPDPAGVIERVLNNLLKIRELRGNTKLTAAKSTDKNKLSFDADSNGVYGDIEIYPTESSESAKKINTLNFHTQNGHAALKGIEFPSVARNYELPIELDDPFIWIKKVNNRRGFLFYDVVEPGKDLIHSVSYPKITGIHESSIDESPELLALGAEDFSDMIAAKYYTGTADTVKSLFSHPYFKELSEFKKYIEGWYKNKPIKSDAVSNEYAEEIQVKFLKLIIKHSKSATNVAVALRNLRMQGKNSDSIDITGIDKEGDGTYKISVPPPYGEMDEYFLNEEEFKIFLDILQGEKLEELQLAKLQDSFYEFLEKFCSCGFDCSKLIKDIKRPTKISTTTVKTD